MPRKNDRPAERKALKKKQAKVKAQAPQRVISLAHHNGPTPATMALILHAMLKGKKDK